MRSTMFIENHITHFHENLKRKNENRSNERFTSGHRFYFRNNFKIVYDSLHLTQKRQFIKKTEQTFCFPPSPTRWGLKILVRKTKFWKLAHFLRELRE